MHCVAINKKKKRARYFKIKTIVFNAIMSIKSVKSKKSVRYFDANGVKEEELQPIKIKKEKNQKIEGDFIAVADNKPPKIPKTEFKGKIIKVHENKRFNKKLLKNARTKQRVEDIKPKIPKKLLQKYSHGGKVNSKGVQTKYFKEKLQRKEIILDYAVEQAARTELLLPEDQGFLQADRYEITAGYKQSEIAANVDVQSASKHFKLSLDFGPYSFRYTKNGRDLLLGGKRGHVAAFDWVIKKLRCEMNVMEEVADVAWLHVNTMFACAQKDWVRIYDTQGSELHCIKRMYRVNRLEFLPYHFLLAAVNTQGYATWLDVSIGEMIGQINTKLGDIRIMRQNPANGALCIGGGKGVVTMWSPTVREPLASMLCHPTPLSALAVDPKGQHMVTSGLDAKLKVWDVRMLNGPVRDYKLAMPANQVDVSQRGVLAFSQGMFCEMYSNLLIGKNNNNGAYLRHKANAYVHEMRFCPYEDVLGIGTAKGFESLLVPGAGEANFDAYEANPYQSKTQRREHEVHSLLEKIPAELITLNPNEIANVDLPTLQEKVDEKRALFHVKPPKINFTAKRKMKGRGGSAKAAKNKQIVKDMKRKEFITEIRQSKKEIIKTHADKNDKNFIPLESKKPKTVLDRFKPKTKKIA